MANYYVNCEKTIFAFRLFAQSPFKITIVRCHVGFYSIIFLIKFKRVTFGIAKKIFR